MVVDANVLLYAINEDAAQHHIARKWLERRLNGDRPVAFAWLVMVAFLRIATGPAFAAPLSVKQACDTLADWLSFPAALVVDPTPRHLALVQELLTDTGRAGPLVPDAHLAALAIDNGLAVATFDADFRRFQTLRVVIPAPDDAG